MTYDSIQTGPLGRTVELYEFNQAGEFTRVTSAANDQVGGGPTFEVLEGMTRTRPVQGNENNSGEIKITVPRNFSVAAQFRGQLPSNLPTLTIFKKHLNDPSDALFTYWKGTIVNCSFEDKAGTATLVGQPETRVFDRPVPRAVYSGLCNHQLYDSGCKVIKADYTTPAIAITSVSADGTTLTISGLRAAAQVIANDLSLPVDSAQLDNFWMRGVLSTTTSPAEHRMVVETNIGGDPDTIRINIPFRTIAGGSTVNASAGCPHDINSCLTIFGNATNFGGFPYVPTNNPFNIELDSGRDAGGQREVRTFGGVAQ